MHVAAGDSHFVNGNEYVDFTMTFQGVLGHDSLLIQSHGSGGNGLPTGEGSGYQGLLIDDVTIRELCGTLTEEQSWDFESDIIPTSGPGLGLFTQTVPQGWMGSTVEVQGGLTNYGGHTGFGASTPAHAGPETQYLDTAASSGNINLTTNSGADVATGGKAQIEIAVAPQHLTYPGNGLDYETSANSGFDLVFNDQVVKHFTLADFDSVTNQEFKSFTFNNDVNGQSLVGVEGKDHISIVSHGEEFNYTGSPSITSRCASGLSN